MVTCHEPSSYVQSCERRQTHRCTFMHAFTHVQVFEYIYICMYMYMYVYIYMNIYLIRKANKYDDQHRKPAIPNSRTSSDPFEDMQSSMEA